MGRHYRAVASVVCALGLLLAGRVARAVPSYSRQMLTSCSTCHTAYPKLTPFGRQFKARGYTTIATEQITKTLGDFEILGLSKPPPLAAMLIASYTNLQRAENGTQNGAILLPDQFSFFYAGRISPQLGDFLQITYDGQADHFSMDNTDVRFAYVFTVAGKPLVFGATMNNNPTVQDLWNTTPAWGWPYFTTGAWPGEGDVSALVDGTLAQAVGGVGVYLFWDERIYIEGDAYRSAPLGTPRFLASGEASQVIRVLAPYARLAWQDQLGDFNYEVGAYGMYAQIYPGADAGLPINRGPTDKYFDVAGDAQLQYYQQADNTAYELHGTYIYERRDFDATAPGSDGANLHTFRVDAQAYWNMIGLSAGYFFKTGTRNQAVFDTLNGKPDTNGVLASVIFRPWLNTELRVQYTVYAKYNGAYDNYDDSRDAWMNNTLAVFAWIVY